VCDTDSGTCSKECFGSSFNLKSEDEDEIQSVNNFNIPRFNRKQFICLAIVSCGL